MIPEHYVEVNLKKVDFELTKDNIVGKLKGTGTYRTTKYIVLNNDNEWAVAKVRKRKEPRLFPTIIGINVLSLPENTVYIERKDVDVHNKTLMAGLASSHEGKAVIVKGRFEHVSFILDEPVLKIKILDVVPPESRLMTLAEEVVRISPMKKALNFVPEYIDLTKLISDIDTKYVVFPCRASELTSHKRHFFLDENPKLAEEELRNITLVGCRLSNNIFKSVYKRSPGFMDICPKDLISKDELTLTRCCMYEEPCVEGKVAYVPWGATTYDIHTALRKLVRLADF
jgi:hypothetical protein